MIPPYQLPKSQIHRLGLALMLPVALLGAIAFPSQLPTATAQSSGGNRPLTIRSDVQEYDAKSQVITARGNVQMLYPARQLQATAAQAQYFSQERRIDFSGNVYILQQGNNSIRAEKVTYLIDEGRFIALPQSNRQVESVYMVEDSNLNGQTAKPAPKTPSLKRSN
ncbi:OstA family protein [Anabaena cylindrica FACHB-243]|uniref:OstA family protein n=1 Tax=Anabaena cylindrica (strain ATCC 27899 / PCC 7122) TaxID=272123 RepID=K9ZL74_ANACC|nr:MULTISPECIES: LptA/OstA family protein [Anabaena]AFZ59946.1 OstA family protein [Anabaena cylindrica PCC 7122]MBD2419039.1 OstA family protein [Anabaena cylindrica FACHB-243]MBY5282680.1 OstA family protein [Anabaena sp. CCAP 1446/1C]MBY5307556.1 OstA family protein [Anabaena sp. CCAP 1446/1C]MCM2404913.1 OstA family protein [Anabaena sp. CCAP 1446/1C]